LEYEALSLTEPALHYLRSQLRIDMSEFLKTLYLEGLKTNNSLKRGEMQLLRELIYHNLVSVKRLKKNFDSSVIGEWKSFDRIEYRLNDDGILLVKTLFSFD